MATLRAPLDGSLLTIPELADFYAAHSPDLPWLVFCSNNSADDTAMISYLQMVQASHRVAYILRPERKGPEREVIAVLLNTDTVLYVVTILGILRAGFIPYPMSPRNSSQGVIYMMQASSCRRILAHAPTAALAHQVKTGMASEGLSIHVDNLPGLSCVFPHLQDTNNASEFHPYPPSPQPARALDTAWYIHSSGSTGFPKSIRFTNIRLLQWMKNDNLFGTSPVRIGGMGLPSFHGMGLLLQLAYPLISGREAVVFAPQDPAPPIVPHPRNVYEVSKKTGCTALVALPSYVEAWSHSPEVISYLKTLSVLIYGGGPLSFTVGDKLFKAGVRIFNGYGGTEFGNPTLPWDKVPFDGDWYWFHFKDASNMRFESQGDGTYELVVDETDEYYVGVHNVPGKKAFATSDLFEPHPTRLNLWKIVGRKDDVITLSTGEKFVPIPQESLISADALVAGCVMFGREREQPGILIEPHAECAIDPADQESVADFRRRVWPSVERANADAPGFAKVYKEMILVTDPTKPLPRAGKGTVIRKQAIALYADAIEKLYETVEESTNADGVAPPGSWTLEELEPWLLEQATSLAISRLAISPTIDLFQQGFDSLNATFFRNRIIGALRGSSQRQAAQNISANIIFEYPTIQQLARALQSLSNSTPSLDSAIDSTQQRIKDIQTMITKYTADLPTPIVRTAGASVGLPVVLLTGSTGNIGSHILAYLLTDRRVGKVYALNRPSADPEGRLKAAFEQRDLPLGLLDDERFVSLVGDVTQEAFGMERSRYDALLAALTHVIHNAWTVNFNLSLQAFEDQVAGVRKLIDISASAARPIRLLVTSSIGITNNWDPAQGQIPEQPLSDPAIAADIGYTASKYAVEQILVAAVARGIDAMAVRMGQACGPRATGAWGTTEWLPILVKSSITMGCFPAMSGPVAWMPLDAIGEAYVDWVLSESALPALVNVVHPIPITWDIILRGICDEIGGNLTIISIQDWVAKLESVSVNPSAQDLLDIPALKLISFFRSLAQAAGSDKAEYSLMNHTYETKALRSSSPSIARLQPMSVEHARMWIRYWKRKGFIST